MIAAAGVVVVVVVTTGSRGRDSAWMTNAATAQTATIDAAQQHHAMTVTASSAVIALSATTQAAVTQPHASASFVKLAPARRGSVLLMATSLVHIGFIVFRNQSVFVFPGTMSCFDDFSAAVGMPPLGILRVTPETAFPFQARSPPKGRYLVRVTPYPFTTVDRDYQSMRNRYVCMFA
jgi:hypothetical protein